jgi:hypothetical protein
VALGEYFNDKLAGRLAIGIAIVANRIRGEPGIEIGRRCITEMLEVFRCMALEEVSEVDLADAGGAGERHEANVNVLSIEKRCCRQSAFRTGLVVFIVITDDETLRMPGQLKEPRVTRFRKAYCCGADRGHIRLQGHQAIRHAFCHEHGAVLHAA